MTKTAISRICAAGIVALFVLAAAHEPAVLSLAVIFFAAVLTAMVDPRGGIFWIVGLTPLETFFTIDFNTLKLLKIGLIALVGFRLYMDGSDSSPAASSTDPYRRVLQMLLLSTVFSALVSSLWNTAVGLSQLLLFWGLYFALRRTKFCPRDGGRILKTVVLVSLPVAILAVMQSLFGYGSGLASNEQQAMARQEAFTTFWPSIQRACASFGSSNAAGAFFSAAGLVALLHALLLSRHRIRYLAMSGLLALGLAATFSRGAIAGLLIGLFFIALVIGRRRLRWVLAVSLAGLLTVGYILTPMEQVLGYLRVNDDVLSASVSRVQAWQAAWTMIRQHPLSGIGFYGFKQEMLVNEGDPQAPMHPHNGLLKALVETGVIGGLAYLWYLAVFLRTSTSTLRRCVQQPELLWIFSSIAAVGVCFFGQELVDAGLTTGGSSMAILFATLLGLQTSLRNSLIDLTPSAINS